MQQLQIQSVFRPYLRVHGHGGKFGVDVFAGHCCSVTGEGLGRGHLVLPAEVQRSAAVNLFDLRQVGLRCYHHTWNLAVHEVLLRRKRKQIHIHRQGGQNH